MAADEIVATAADTRMTACQLLRIMPAPLPATPTGAFRPATRRPAVVPSVLTPGQAAMLQWRGFCRVAGSGADRERVSAGDWLGVARADRRLSERLGRRPARNWCPRACVDRYHLSASPIRNCRPAGVRRSPGPC